MTYNETLNYREALKNELKRRQRVNPRYSLRAFARTIGLSPQFVSNMLNGLRELSPEKAYSVAVRLGYSATEISEFCRLVQIDGTTSPKVRAALAGKQDQADTSQMVSLSLDAFEVIADWYHYGILELAQCDGFRDDPKFISRRLGISLNEAKTALARLLRLGLLTRASEGKIVKTDSYIATPTDRPNRALRHFHAQLIEKAKQALDEQSIEEREISGFTFSVDPERIPEAKQEIQRFYKRMMRLLEPGRPSEVYQMNVQFFRLTKNEQKDNK